MSKMKIIDPIEITDTILTSSNVIEEDHDTYAAGTTYSKGTRCILEHRIYESGRDANTGHNPPDNLESETTDVEPWWIDISATNKWKMFDGKSRAITTNPGTIVIEITPGQLFNSIAILGLDADSIVVKVTHPTLNVVYEKDVSLIDNSHILDYYSWFFVGALKKDTIVLTDLPSYTNTTVIITITQSEGNAEVGECVIGTQEEIGVLLYGYSVGASDYSKKGKDENGNATLEKGSNAKLLSLPLSVQRRLVHYVDKKLKRLLGVGVVFIGHEDYQETITYGFINDFAQVVPGERRCECSLDIEELN